METAALTDPLVGGFEADADALASAFEEIEVAPAAGTYPEGTCWWCGSEEVLIGLGSLTYDPVGGGFHPRVTARKACGQHISNLLRWKEDAEEEYERKLEEERFRILTTWLMRTLHGWQLDDDGVCWRGKL